MKGFIPALKKEALEIETSFNRIVYEEGYSEEATDYYLSAEDLKEKQAIAESMRSSNRSIQAQAQKILRSIKRLRSILDLIEDETYIKYSGMIERNDNKNE